jgi:hypothetical protein
MIKVRGGRVPEAWCRGGGITCCRTVRMTDAGTAYLIEPGWAMAAQVSWPQPCRFAARTSFCTGARP